MPIGTPDGQQLWERFATLVAVDIWHSVWSQIRLILKVQGDNVIALTMILKM